MMTTGVKTFDKTLEKTRGWLNELMGRLAWSDPEKAYLALRATLHALRDRLTPAEAVDLGAQLPMLVRGFYFEGWRLTGTPVKERHKEEFLAHIAKALEGYGLGDPEEIARGVFMVLADHVTQGEMDDVRHVLPRELRELFDGARLTPAPW